MNSSRNSIGKKLSISMMMPMGMCMCTSMCCALALRGSMLAGENG